LRLVALDTHSMLEPKRRELLCFGWWVACPCDKGRRAREMPPLEKCLHTVKEGHPVLKARVSDQALPLLIHSKPLLVHTKVYIQANASPGRVDLPTWLGGEQLLGPAIHAEQSYPLNKRRHTPPPCLTPCSVPLLLMSHASPRPDLYPKFLPNASPPAFLFFWPSEKPTNPTAAPLLQRATSSGLSSAARTFTRTQPEGKATHSGIILV